MEVQNKLDKSDFLHLCARTRIYLLRVCESDFIRISRHSVKTSLISIQNLPRQDGRFNFEGSTKEFEEMKKNGLSKLKWYLKTIGCQHQLELFIREPWYHFTMLPLTDKCCKITKASFVTFYQKQTYFLKRSYHRPIYPPGTYLFSALATRSKPVCKIISIYASPETPLVRQPKLH